MLRWKGKWLGKNGFSLGRHVGVYGAEVLGICGGLNTAVSSSMIGSVSIIHICMDNLNVAQQAGTIPNGASQDRLGKFKLIAENWLSRGGKISVQWTPAHMGIKGNDITENEAKRNSGYPSTFSATEEVHIIAYTG